MSKKRIKYIMVDVDGTLTNGYYHLGPNGEISKSFFTRDFWAMSRAMEEGFEVLFVTGAKDTCTYARAASANITVIGDSHEKVKDVEEVIPGIDWDTVAFMGDGENDLGIFEKAGITGCPIDSVDEVVNSDMSLVSRFPGGSGCVHEFIKMIFALQDIPWVR